MKQLKLTGIKRTFDSRYGGSAQKGRRKSGRPFVPKLPMHFIFKSSKAKGPLSMRHRRKRAKVDARIYTLARRNHIQILEYANAGNHLHILLKSHSRDHLTKFLRLAAGQIAQLMTGAKKGIKFGKYWSALAWSRLIKPGKALAAIQRYLRLNQLEALALEFGYKVIRWNKIKKDQSD